MATAVAQKERAQAPGLEELPVTVTGTSAANVLTGTEPEEEVAEEPELTAQEALELKLAKGRYIKEVLENRVRPMRFYINVNHPDYYTNRGKIATMGAGQFILEDTELLDDGMGYQRDSYELQKQFMFKTEETILWQPQAN